MPRLSLHRDHAIEFLPVDSPLRFVFMEYFGGRHYTTHLFTQMELRAVLMVTSEFVRPEIIADVVSRAVLPSKDINPDQGVGTMARVVRDFAFYTDGVKVHYGTEREAPEAGDTHPLLKKLSDHRSISTHVELRVEADMEEYTISDVHLRLSVMGPKDMGKTISFRLYEREAFYKHVLSTLKSTS